jgi:hypothetical protein
MAVSADPVAYVRAYPGHAMAYRHLLPSDMVARIEAAETDADMRAAVAPVMVPVPCQQQQARDARHAQGILSPGCIPEDDASEDAPATVEAATFPQFGRFVCDGDSVSLDVDGFTVTATVHHDSDAGAPWDSCEGHGPVSDWTRRDKRPGERVLSSDHGSHRFYDVAEAMRIAKRDSWWGVIPYRTPGIAAAAAVESDFAVLKAWCDDEWAYCGIVLTVEREGVELVGEFDHALWGVEYNFPDSDNAYLADVAGQLLDDALDDARAVLARLAA